MPGALYALLKLCFAGPSPKANPPNPQRVEVPIVPRMHRLAAAGHASEASREAIRRLRGSGIRLAVTPLEVLGELSVRSAAALLFPLELQDRALLRQLVARPEPDEPVFDSEAMTTPSGAIS